jgi:hypothetical protein
VPRYDWGWVIVVRCVVGELDLDSRSWVQFVHSYVFFPPGKIRNHGQATILLTDDPEVVV